MPEKILFITLSNIGDVILTLPSLDYLRMSLPAAHITVMVGPRPKEIFEGNPAVERVIVYDKRSRLREKIRLFSRLKKEGFDAVVDLRNTFFGAFLPARSKTSPFLRLPRGIKHMKERHLYRTRRVVSGILGKETPAQAAQAACLFIRPEDRERVEGVLKINSITAEDKLVVVSAGARSHIKRWQRQKFSELISCLSAEPGIKIVLVGDKEDAQVNRQISESLGNRALDLSSGTTIGQLACLLEKARLVLTNDSAVLHLASYLDRPVIAIFGPTNEQKYGPWSGKYCLVKKEVFCRPCEQARCRLGGLECMSLIKADDVLGAARAMLGLEAVRPQARAGDFRRILVVRTDRIGDVLLSTPVIRALREEFPCAYIAMMVSPYARDIVEGNPCLDEVIVYDKEGRHKSWKGSVKFAFSLRRKKFDLALVLHPANRAHIVTFIAGIPRRVGYDRKFAFLLTDRIKHTKQFGERHELDYTLDFVRYLGIEPRDKSMFMPLRRESESWADELLSEQGINESDKLLVIHPSASCPSRLWPLDRFAQAADRLVDKYGFKTVVIASPRDTARAKAVIGNMRHPAINLAGKTSVSQMASLLRRCRLFISNDTGPVHIAASLDIPVISIFGRKQRGLSPKRWGPLGKNGRFLQKDAGCIECLAHNCVKEFACLKAISVDEVVSAADRLLQGAQNS